MVTINEFLTSFPEFMKTDPSRIVAYLEQVECEACYDNLGKDALNNLAIKLHTAHLLTIYDQSSTMFSNGGQKVQKLKTKHDEIQYFGSADDPFGMSSSQYGTRLQALIDRNSVGFDIGVVCW